VVFDPEKVAKEEIEEWHRLGVRGVRVNLKSVGRSIDERLERLVRKSADRIREWGWVMQFYVDMETVVWLEKVVPELGVKVCLDHFGSPTLPPFPSHLQPNETYYDPYALPGFPSLISLLHQGSTYVKISGAYRISSDFLGFRDLEPLALELLRVAGKSRLVFATDWPHTRFEGLDIRPFVDKVIEWCGEDEELVERVFRGNAEELWDACCLLA
jgi:predicted TIM-barrel fold metal-dependent hydrolase